MSDIETTKRRGWWANHKFSKHSVERDIEITGFIGWKKFEEILDATEKDRDRKLVLTTFKLGGRISEILNCQHFMFKVETSPEDNNEYLLCHMIPLLKRWKKIGEYINDHGTKRFKTEKVKAFRTIALPIKDSVEPFSQEFVKFSTEKRRGLLFPSPDKRRRGQHLTSTRAYQILRYELGSKVNLYLYNHLLRAWRASQLRRERNYGLDDLMEFFKWRDYKTAMIYGKEGVWGLASKFSK